MKTSSFSYRSLYVWMFLFVISLGTPSLNAQVIHDQYERKDCKPVTNWAIDYQIPLGHALTGFGVAVKKKRPRENQITVVKVEYRKINANGTLGPRILKATGKNPSANPQRWISAPAGHVIVSLGLRVNDNKVTHQKIRYQKIGLVSGKVRLTGPRKELWAPSSRLKVEAECFDHEIPDQAVVTGIRLREKNDNIAGLGLYWGILK